VTAFRFEVMTKNAVKSFFVLWVKKESLSKYSYIQEITHCFGTFPLKYYIADHTYRVLQNGCIERSKHQNAEYVEDYEVQDLNNASCDYYIN